MPDNLRDEVLEVIEAVLEAQLRAIRKLRQPHHMQMESEGGQRKKPISHLDIVHDILRAARRPLHISEIVKLASGRFKVDLDRESVVSALSKRVARKDRFIRTAPNTFALLSDR